jgi:glycosyltransferase involved in cell wall biosynthesis
MKPLPTVSIIMPNYNHSCFLERAIQQHLSQTILPLEIIIIDDGSTDGSVTIISKMAKENPLINPLFLKINQGVNEANNKGLNMARGDYVFFSAVDDFVRSDFLEKSLKILSLYPQAAFSFSDPAEYILKSKKKLPYPLYLSNQPCYFSPEQITYLLRKTFFTFPSNTVLFRKEYLKQLGGFFPSLERGSDWFACFKLALCYGVCYIPDVLAWFCIRENSYSAVGLRSSTKQRSTHYKIVDLVKNDNDLLCKLKKAGVLYEYSWRSLKWILFHKDSRKLVSFFTLRRLVIRSLWGQLRSYLPYKERIIIRKIHHFWKRRG